MSHLLAFNLFLKAFQLFGKLLELTKEATTATSLDRRVFVWLNLLGNLANSLIVKKSDEL